MRSIRILTVSAFAGLLLIGCAHGRHCKHEGHAAGKPCERPGEEPCEHKDGKPCARHAAKPCEHHGQAAGAPAFLNSDEAAARNLPYSEAVRVGGMLYLAGQLGTVAGKLELVPGGIEAESAQALENVKAVLERNGSSLAKVVKCTVFLADMNDWPAFNQIYRKHFQPPFPARSALGAHGLALNAHVEIECLAAAQ